MRELSQLLLQNLIEKEVYTGTCSPFFLFSLSERINNICQQLLKPENLYTAELTDEDMNDIEINQWIHSLINIRAGYLSLNVEFEQRPVSLKPILKVQDKKEYYEIKHSHGFRGEILQNLHEITFYINGSEHGSHENFKLWKINGNARWNCLRQC